MKIEIDKDTWDNRLKGIWYFDYLPQNKRIYIYFDGEGRVIQCSEKAIPLAEDDSNLVKGWANLEANGNFRMLSFDGSLSDIRYRFCGEHLVISFMGEDQVLKIPNKSTLPTWYESFIKEEIKKMKQQEGQTIRATRTARGECFLGRIFEALIRQLLLLKGIKKRNKGTG